MMKLVERQVWLSLNRIAFCRDTSQHTDISSILLSAVLKIVSDLFLACDHGKVSLLAILDLPTAFDTVNHAILFEHLQFTFGVYGNIFDWIEAFITNHTQTVRFAGVDSAVSVVGPIPFQLCHHHKYC